MNKVDPTKKVQFIMEVATDTLEFLDLKLKFDNLIKFLLLCLLKILTVLHMFCLVCVFLKITLKTYIKVSIYVLKGLAILMRNLNSIVQNVKTI